MIEFFKRLYQKIKQSYDEYWDERLNYAHKKT